MCDVPHSDFHLTLLALFPNVDMILPCLFSVRRHGVTPPPSQVFRSDSSVALASVFR